jgi:hypothetical protein
MSGRLSECWPVARQAQFRWSCLATVSVATWVVGDLASIAIRPVGKS